MREAGRGYLLCLNTPLILERPLGGYVFIGPVYNILQSARVRESSDFINGMGDPGCNKTLYCKNVKCYVKTKNNLIKFESKTNEQHVVG